MEKKKKALLKSSGTPDLKRGPRNPSIETFGHQGDPGHAQGIAQVEVVPLHLKGARLGSKKGPPRASFRVASCAEDYFEAHAGDAERKKGLVVYDGVGVISLGLLLPFLSCGLVRNKTGGHAGSATFCSAEGEKTDGLYRRI